MALVAVVAVVALVAVLAVGPLRVTVTLLPSLDVLAVTVVRVRTEGLLEVVLKLERMAHAR